MKVGVIGAGQMGSGIAEVFALAGNEVKIYEVDRGQLDRALKNIKWSLSKLAEKGRVKDVEEIMSRLHVSEGLSSFQTEELVVEAVFEDFNVKAKTLEEVSRRLSPESLIATNTSSIPITELSRAVWSPERFLGMHFFNPPVLMELVEVIKGDSTRDVYFNKALEVVRNIGKIALPVRKDVPGFVVNRILFRVFNKACSILDRYTVEQVDWVAYYDLGFPMGIFMLLDYTGLDLNLSISKEVAKRGLKLNCPEVEKLVANGKRGAKSGSGFYDWKERPRIERVQGGPSPKELIEDAFREGLWLIKEGVATEEEIDKGTMLGLGLRSGIMTMGRRLGLS